MKKWNKIAELMQDVPSYRDIKVGSERKEHYIDVFMPELRGGTPRKILDIGAGNGIFCHVCKKLGHEVLANRPSKGPGKPSYRGYREACAFFGVPVFSFTYGEGQADLETNSFDVVCSQGMIGSVSKDLWPSTLDEMLRVVKPGGILLLSPNREGAVENEVLLMEWSKSSKVTLLKHWKKDITWMWKKLE